MFKASIGASNRTDPKEAVKESIAKMRQAGSGLSDAKMIFAFSSCSYSHEDMLDEFSAELPAIPVIGNTSHTGVITCLLYTYDAADELLCVDLGGSRLF